MENYKKVFTDDYIDTTNKIFLACLFDGCILESRQPEYTKMMYCQMKHCFFEGDGWPLGLNFSNSKIRLEDLKKAI